MYQQFKHILVRQSVYVTFRINPNLIGSKKINVWVDFNMSVHLKFCGFLMHFFKYVQIRILMLVKILMRGLASVYMYIYIFAVF